MYLKECVNIIECLTTKMERVAFQINVKLLLLIRNNESIGGWK